MFLMQLHFTSRASKDNKPLIMLVCSTDCGQADAGTAAVYDETGKVEKNN